MFTTTGGQNQPLILADGEEQTGKHPTNLAYLYSGLGRT